MDSVLNFSKSLNLADRALGFDASLSFPEIPFLKMMRPMGGGIGLPKASFGLLSPAASLKRTLTIRSSSEWNEITARRPPGLSIFRAESKT